MFDDLTPSELHSLCKEMKEAAQDERPTDVNESNPASLRAYDGEYYSNEEKSAMSGALHTSINLVLGAWGDFLPQLLGKVPVPNSKPRTGTAARAEGFDRLISYRDREFRMHDQYRSFLRDAFLRGTGFLRTVWDCDYGISRSRHFSPCDVWIDDTAKTLEDAMHVIERHSCRRWEAIELFGESATKLPPKQDRDDPAKGKVVAVPEALRIDGKYSKIDMVEYYLLWSKHGGEDRIYAFHDTWNQGYLYEGEDGKPGMPWPFKFEDGEWHLTSFRWEENPDSPWGMSYYRSVQGPIKCAQRMANYELWAREKNARQWAYCKQGLAAEVRRVAENQSHMPIVEIPDSVANGVEDLSKVLVFASPPDLPPAATTGVARAKQWMGEISGQSAIQEGNAQNIETAAESVRLAQADETRIADRQSKVEEAITCAHRKEAMYDAWFMPRRSMLCWYPAGYEGKEEDEASEDQAEEKKEKYGDAPRGPVDDPKAKERSLAEKVAAGGGHLDDIPYQDAVLLEKGPPSKRAAASEQEAMMTAQQMGQQIPQVSPEVEVRMRYGVPVDADVEILEPGAEAFMGPELAQQWVEGATTRQVNMELSVAVKTGSTSRLGQMNKVNQVMMGVKAFMPWYQQNGLDEQAMAMVNAFCIGTENDDMQGCKVLPEQLQAGQQKMAQQAQAAQQAEQAATVAEIEAKKKAEIEKNAASEQQRGAADNEAATGANQGKALDLQKENVSLQKSQVGLASTAIKQQGEASRERQREQSQFAIASGLGRE